MLAKLTDARFSGDIWENAIWNLDDVSKWENICRSIFNRYGFRPLGREAQESRANAATNQIGEGATYFKCWAGPCPRKRDLALVPSS